MPAMEAIKLTLDRVPYIANYMSIPIDDIQAAAEYFTRTYPSGCYFVIDWDSPTAVSWSVFQENKFHDCFYFTWRESKTSIQPIRARS